MQVKNWKYMFQTSENYNNIQEPTNKQTKLGRYFAVQTGRQNILWSA